jgi:hypothetical protein
MCILSGIYIIKKGCDYLEKLPGNLNKFIS